MRTFNFKSRVIGEEKYLTYTMGEETELDEDILDYCEENEVKELIPIIYEEDDDYDYLTYDVTGLISVDEFIQKEVNSAAVINILRNVANELISVKEQAIPLAYLLLNRNFMYIDENTYNISFICLPVESQGKIMVEFKGFMRQLLANMKYDVEEELSYVGKLLTYINGDNFNLRGLIGLTEALMEESGISFEEAGAIEAEDGVEIVNTEEPTVDVSSETNINDFMSSLSDSDEALPEIGDDEEEAEEEKKVEDDELESILPAGMQAVSDDVDDEAQVEEAPVEETPVEDPPVEETSVEETSVDETSVEETPVEETEEEAPVEETPVVPEKKVSNPNTKETDIEVLRQRIEQIVKDAPKARTVGTREEGLKTIEDLDNYLDSRPPVVKRNVVKVNRAAMIQNAAAEEAVANGETEELNDVPVIEELTNDINIESSNDEEKPKSKSILSKSIAEVKPKTSTLLNAPKAMPYLIRVNTEERIMLNKTVFKLGKASRGVDYTVSGNGAISRQHAIISQRDGVCYIKDNKSTNHTYVNGKMVEDGEEEILTHESMIKLGDEEFIFKIR